MSSAKRCSAASSAASRSGSCGARRARWRALRARRGRGTPRGTPSRERVRTRTPLFARRRRGRGRRAAAAPRGSGCGRRRSARRAAPAEHGAGGDRAGDDLVLEHDRDVVGLRRVRHRGGVYAVRAQPRASAPVAICGRNRCRRDPDVTAVHEDGLALVPPGQLRRGEVGAAEAAPGRQAGHHLHARTASTSQPRSSHGSSRQPRWLGRAFR